jgi:hypothetical protein
MMAEALLTDHERWDRRHSDISRPSRQQHSRVLLDSASLVGSPVDSGLVLAEFSRRRLINRGPQGTPVPSDPCPTSKSTLRTGVSNVIQ